MSTTTTVDLLKTIVARLRAAPASIARVYVSQAPDTATFPYVVVRKINAQTDPQYSNTRENFDLEVMCFGRPRSMEIQVEEIADAVIATLLKWVESGAGLGLTFARVAQRDSLAPTGDPADRELVTVRVVIEFSAFPRYLTVPLTTP